MLKKQKNKSEYFFMLDLCSLIQKHICSFIYCVREHFSQFVEFFNYQHKTQTLASLVVELTQYNNLTLKF